MPWRFYTYINLLFRHEKHHRVIVLELLNYHTLMDKCWTFRNKYSKRSGLGRRLLSKHSGLGRRLLTKHSGLGRRLLSKHSGLRRRLLFILVGNMGFSRVFILISTVSFKDLHGIHNSFPKQDNDT